MSQSNVLAKLIGRHHSYIEEIEAGRIPLVWEDGGELVWSHLIEIQLSQGKTAPIRQALGAPDGQRSRADLLDEIKLLREIRQSQNEMIRNLKEQSACWDELAGERLETIHALRVELGRLADEDGEL